MSQVQERESRTITPQMRDAQGNIILTPVEERRVREAWGDTTHGRIHVELVTRGGDVQTLIRLDTNRDGRDDYVVSADNRGSGEFIDQTRPALAQLSERGARDTAAGVQALMQNGVTMSELGAAAQFAQNPLQGLSLPARLENAQTQR